MKKMTLEEFNEIPYGEIFATGIQPNSPEGLFMTRDGGDLRWIAKKGYGNDWTVYCHWSYNDEEWISKHGDKLHNMEDVQLCIPCENEMIKLYRR